MALELHLRTIWHLPNQNTIPPKVTDDDKAPFEQHFSSVSQMKSTVTSSLEQNSGNLHNVEAKVTTFLSSLPKGSTISNNIKHISRCHLLNMFRTVAILGLQHWPPDILSGNPKSMYNLLHKHIALKTFEQVSAAYG